MLRAISCLLLALTIGSCGESKEEPFESDDGVRLTCPAGWSITEDKPNEVGGYYLQFEKDGFDSTGMVTFSWVGAVHDLGDFLRGASGSFEAEGYELGEIHNGQFGSHSALKRDFRFSPFGMDHQGALYALHSAGMTFFVMKQEANEDHAENLPGFNLIESSFVCTQ